MAYPEDLLAIARHLACLDPPLASQASLRRAVSTAYYALFHLLISEATLNWEQAEFRDELGRVFDHGKMKAASAERRSIIERQLTDLGYGNNDAVVLLHLRGVAAAFVALQQNRNTADYNNAVEWTRQKVEDLVDTSAEAFESWAQVRRERVAQSYLVSLLGKRP